MIALDTNLLIYAHRAGTPEHARARAAVEAAAAAPSGWGIPLPCLAEFWSVVTHPAAPPKPSTAEQASRFLDALVRAGAQVWIPGTGFADRLLRTAAELRLQGPRIFDLQIALVALGNGATELWSHDAAFRTVPGLRLRDPLR